ncbi:hypothetical protein EJ05DRAFT_309849 [Pseudovirgaria hyperparasitica]|uniref:Mid2 domain-containing protein n=1 Tax=Pseudovirgaria hyperparasitica TaxID=470096 RepID=A0A6A6WCL5_9PEZI|nr:uncharacterized protein EJ05DRAFT_309849 [Pseudovirgaria hyperparasitica]KAF2759794.1 hypothetical protein EJ05DRAFT_309849 [Pseudovirgaria hyperparasitica]
MRFGGRSRLIGMGLFAIMSVSAASEMILPLGEGIFHKRQDTTAVSSRPPAASSGGDTPVPTSSPEEPSSVAPTSAAPTSAQPTQDDNSSGDSSPTPTSNRPSSNGGDAATTVRTTLSETLETTPLVTQVTRITVITSRVTSGSSVFDTAITSEVVSEMTTGSAVATLSPSNDGSNSDGGLSSTNQKIVGGVVGGVGGALLLGGIVLVFLRLRKKRQNKVQIDDDFAGMDYKRNENSRNSEPLNNSTFQNANDQYHQPAARPNAAANF